MVSSKKVADLAGVSISTVSRVFSNPSLVNEKTRKKILKIANELNYFPDINARALKLNKSHIIGVIVSDISNPFYMKILKEVMTWSDKNNTKYRFYVTFTNEDKTNEIGAIRSLISSKVDYMIFTPVSNNNKDVESMIIDNNLLTLQLYRHAYDSLDSLKIDDEFGTYLATTELIENNHKEILLLDFDVPTPTNRDIGYFAAFKEKNMDIN
jgi:DNA-binding LacI/PurR family transcriptional regulator